MRVLAGLLFALLIALLIEVLFEGWIQVRFGARSVTASGATVVDLLDWPKQLKNGLYIGLALLSAIKITLDSRWRDLRTGADLALVALGAAMVLAGLVGGSSTSLIGQALFVYFRGVVVFYAWRALQPTWRQIVLALKIVGGVVALNVVIALVELVVGVRAYQILGWTDLKWAKTNRAHALLTHPNHLGHLLALTILGLTCWMLTRPRVGRRTKIALVVVAVALAASQSREAVAAVLSSIVLIWLLVRVHWRRLLTVVVLIAVSAVGIVVARPSNWVEWQRRLVGVVDAIRVPSGAEGTVPKPTVTTSPAPGTSATGVPAREIRVLYYQQGLRLWTHQPIVGYGVGQFGGIVAQENNPNWNLNPRFGPEGFDRHGFKSVQVDSFWLHLLVETGSLGLLAYLVWLFLLIRPLLRRIRRDRPARGEPGEGPQSGDGTNSGQEPPPAPVRVLTPVQAFAVWAVAAIAFVCQVAFLSASLEDPLLPALLFTILGMAWVVMSPDMPVASVTGTVTDDPVDRHDKVSAS